MAAQVLKCGCVFDGKEFSKYCREHAQMVLRKRWEKQIERTSGGKGQ